MISNELPRGRHDITFSRPGIIDIAAIDGGALQLNDVEAHMKIERRLYDPATGRYVRQERAVITTEWKEATRG